MTSRRTSRAARAPPPPRPRRARRARPAGRRGGLPEATGLGGALLGAFFGAALALAVARPGATSDASAEVPAPAATPSPPDTRAAVVTARVLDGAGTPVVGAAVACVPPDGLAGTWSQARTDARGRALLHLAAGAGPVRVLAWSGHGAGAAGPVDLAPGEVAEVDLTLDRLAAPGALRVRALAGDPPAPVQGPLQYRLGEAFGMALFTEGARTFQRAPSPLAPLALWGEGLAPVCVAVEVPPGGAAEVTLRLDRAATLAGRVRGGAAPRGGRVAAALALGPWGPVWLGSAEVDADGRFALAGLRPGAEHRVGFAVPGHLPFDVTAVPDAPLEVTPPGGPGLEVLVDEAEGAPVAGAKVTLRLRAPRPWWPDLPPATTDAGGRAAWAGGAEVELVEVEAAGFRPAAVGVDGGRCRVTLERRAARTRVQGVVVDGAGRPLPGVAVHARAWDGTPPVGGATDGLGFFSVDAPVGGALELSLERPGAPRVVRHVEVASDETVNLGRLTLASGVRVRGRVEGALAAQADHVRAAGPGGEVERAAVTDVATFDLGWLAPGRWTLTAGVRRPSGQLGFHRREVVLEGEAAEVVLRLDHADDDP
ncbi:MAG: carboxypeptidase-like regulatory domain-containing protein [Planctomycetes bacterium]|nr:carboxypeptidase-like regulatory domain-containing protein [Planctomycetota bacterium]